MALNFGILSQVPSFGQQFAAGQQAAQAQQERNMLRQAQAEQMQFQRENMLAQREERAALTQERQARQARAAQRQQFLTGAAEALAQGGNNLDRPTLMKVLQSGVQAEEPSLIQFARESLKALDEEELYQRESQRLSAAPGAAPTREEVQNMLRSPSPRMREQGKALLPTLPTPEKPMVVGGNLVSPTGQVLFTSPEKPRQSKLLTPEEEAQQLRMRPLPQPREPKEPNKPVEVVGPDGKTIIVSAEEAIARRMTPAKAMEGLAPKEIQRREAVFPQAKQSVTTVTNTMSTIEQTIDRLLQNKSGLNGVTGLVGGRTPALTDAARAADADLEQLANLAFVQGITELRAASKTGAGVGNVSNKEGDRFENLKASLKRTQSYDDMVAALKRLKAQATSTRDTVNTEFTDMYDYRQGRAAPSAPAAPAAGAQQPMYARNPTTGQRIMSTDGGNTWTPVR